MSVLLGLSVYRRALAIAASFVIILTAGSASHAASVTAKLTNVDLTNFSVTVVNSSGTYTETGGAGKFYWDGSVAGGANPAGLNGTFSSFCIDLKDWVSIGSTFTYTYANLTDAPILNGAGAGINSGLAGGMGASKADALSLLFGKHYSQVVDVATAGAFQAAIWEIVYEDVTSTFGSYDVTTLNPGSSTYGFRINSPSSVTTLANSWLNDLTSSGPRLSLAAITSNTYQDQIVIVPSPTGSLAGMSLLGSLGLIAWIKRRSRETMF